MGRFQLTLLAALAELERDLIRERTLAGLKAARARGRKGGPKPKLVGRRLALARQMYDEQKKTVSEIAETLGVGRATVYRALEREQAAAG
jgi:DNA invertase Pin-like site-specific DNA recombinase